MRGTPGRSSLARKIESFTRGFISTRVQLSLCQCVTPRGTFARHAFGARSIRRVRVPIIGKATFFFSFSLSLSFFLSLFLPFNQRGILTLFASCQGATFVIHAKTGSRGVGFYEHVLEKRIWWNREWFVIGFGNNLVWVVAARID